MKVLLTGAAGFIGSHSTQALLKLGHDVVGMDNLNDYYDPKRKLENIEEIKAGEGAERFEFIKLDLRDREGLARLFEAHKFDAVVNLGAMAGVRVSIEDPHLYCDVNLTGTLNLLLECVKHKIGNFVLASTSSAYGATEIMPFVETDPCDRPLAPYAASKRAAEMMCFTYHHLFGVNCTCLRFFTVYGPRGRPDMMAYKVLDNIFFDDSFPGGLKMIDFGNMFFGQGCNDVAFFLGTNLDVEVCARICLHTHARTLARARTNTHIHTHIHMHARERTHAHTYAYTHARAYLRPYGSSVCVVV